MATHIVIDACLTLKDVEDWLGAALPDASRVERHTPDWLVQCLVKKVICPTSSCPWVPFTPPPPAATVVATASTAAGSQRAKQATSRRRVPSRELDSDSDHEARRPAREGRDENDKFADWLGAGSDDQSSDDGRSGNQETIVADVKALRSAGVFKRSPWLVPVAANEQTGKPGERSAGPSAVVGAPTTLPDAKYFACQTTTGKQVKNRNQHLSRLFDMLARCYQMMPNEHWRYVTYNKVATKLKGWPVKITTEHELRKLKLGKQSHEKVRGVRQR